MPCHHCGCEFGFLKKEIGCDICGFSCCKKCCSKRVVLEKPELKKKLICNRCFENMSSNKVSNAGSISPPLAHKKRMAALKKQSFSVDSGSSVSYQWDNEKDKEISDRLQRLKKDMQKGLLPSEMEIEERLAKLKGMDPAKYKAPPVMVYRPVDRRTSIDQAHELMKQVKEEVNLDSQLIKPEDEIAIRLARLRDQEVPQKAEEENIIPTVSHSVEYPSKSEEMDIEAETVAFQKEHMTAEIEAIKEMQNLNRSEDLKKLLTTLNSEKGKVGVEESKIGSDDEEEEANKLIEKLLATNIGDDEMCDLDSFSNGGTKDSDRQSSIAEDEEEFPWCVICNENAKMRCFNCDNDLYCISCFKECHDNFDMTDHKTCPYFPPRDPLA